MKYGLLCLLTFITGTALGQGVFGSVDNGRRDRTYDVLHYRIAVSFDEGQKKVFGKTTIRLRPLAARVDSVVFDATDLDVHSATLAGGTPLLFTNRSPELAVHFPRPYTPDDSVELTVDYTCVPAKGIYFIAPDSCHPRRHSQIWTQGEDMDNHYWFPCYDFPNSKATSEVIATVREGYTVLSNGRLVSEKHDAKNKTRTFHWREDKPHASYLIMMVAGRYSIVRDRYGNLPVLYYVYPEDSTRASLVFGRTPAMLRFFDRVIGYAYPWEKFSQILIDDFMWGGMENTSAVTMNTALLVDQRASGEMSPDPTVAHELAHQWWGDVVTCRDWTHLWLNEGFATYFEELYEEDAAGKEQYQYDMQLMSQGVRGTDQSSGRRPIVSRESYPNNVYSRGAWVLHMLRDLLGEKPFWNALREYIRRNQFRSVETHELELAIQDATGQNLDWFFRQWVYMAGYPRIEVEKTWEESDRVLSLRIKQTQECDSLTSIFRFPLEIQCAGPGWNEVRRVWVDRADSTYLFLLKEKPAMVNIDPSCLLLKDLKYERPREEALYSLNHSVDVAERIRALSDLNEWSSEPDVLAGIGRAARTDPFWAVRQAAARALLAKTADGTAQADDDSVKAVLMSVAHNDSDGRVRAAAVDVLGRFTGSDVGDLLESTVRSDPSYLAVGSGLHALVKVDSTRAFTFTCEALRMASYRDILRLTAIGVLRALANPAAVRVLLEYTSPAYETDVRRSAVAEIGRFGGSDSLARRQMEISVNDGEPAVRRAAVHALLTLGGDDAKAILERRESVEGDPGIREMIEKGLQGD